MRIILTKLSDERHRFDLVRDGRTHESSELETRSLLLHDFIHYALEASAGLSEGFYGRLSAGATLASLMHPLDSSAADGGMSAASTRTPEQTQLGHVETVVGALTRFAKGHLEVDQMLRQYEVLEHSGQYRQPDWLDAECLVRVRERLRQLTGHWKALRHGESLSLPWPPARSEPPGRAE